MSTVSCGDLAAVTSVLGPGELRPTAELVLRHEAIVEDLRRQGPALPVRFGTILADADAVARALAERYAVLAADLARVGDKVELGLSVLWERPTGHDHEPGRIDDQSPPRPEAVEADGPGARYLRARLAELRREVAVRDAAKTIAEDVNRSLGRHALERRCVILPTARLAVRAAYLLDPSQVRAFQATLDEIRRGSSDLRFLLSGPWPPYSFVTPLDTGQRSALSRQLSDPGRQRSSQRPGTRSGKAAEQTGPERSVIQTGT